MKRFSWDLEPITKPKTLIGSVINYIAGVNYQERLQDINEQFDDILTRIETELPKLNAILDKLITDSVGEEKYTVRFVYPKYFKIKNISMATILENSSLDIDNHTIYLNANINYFYHIYNLLYQLCVIQEIKNNALAKDKNDVVDYNKPKTKFFEIIIDYYQSNVNDQNDEVKHISRDRSSSKEDYGELCDVFKDKSYFPKIFQNLNEEDELVDVGVFLGDIQIGKEQDF